MKRWFSGVTKASFRCKEAVSSWVFAAKLEGFGTGLFIRSVLKNSFLAASTCIFALGMPLLLVLSSFSGLVNGKLVHIQGNFFNFFFLPSKHCISGNPSGSILAESC